MIKRLSCCLLLFCVCLLSFFPTSSGKWPLNVYLPLVHPMIPISLLRMEIWLPKWIRNPNKETDWQLRSFWSQSRGGGTCEHLQAGAGSSSRRMELWERGCHSLCPVMQWRTGLCWRIRRTSCVLSSHVVSVSRLSFKFSVLINLSNVFSCLKETFRCSYGGCIRAEQECDGVEDCADGSDERTLNCPGILNQIRGNCR